MSREWLWHPVTFFVVGLVLIAAFAVACSAYVRRHHCTQTGAHREQTLYVPVHVGNTAVLMPQTVNEYEYICDNGRMWL